MTTPLAQVAAEGHRSKPAGSLHGHPRASQHLCVQWTRGEIGQVTLGAPDT